MAIEINQQSVDEPLLIPERIEGIDAAWLTRALAPRHPQLVVSDARLSDSISGASSKLWLQLRTNRNDFPNSVVVKAGFEGHSPAMAYMHLNEVRAYRDVIPTLPVNAPRSYFADVDDRGRAMVILEDLRQRDATFLRLQVPVGYDLAAAILDGLAKFHARWWGSPDLDTDPALASLQSGTEGGVGRVLAILSDPPRHDAFMASPRGAAMPVALHDAARLRQAHDAMRETHKSMPHTVVHGDMHLSNLYTDADGTPGFLDWQPRKAPGIVDVAHVMISALDIPDRRRWEAALIQHYLTRLAAYGVAAPSFDELWLAYRGHVIWGFVVWMHNDSKFQTEAANTAATARFAIAMLDLDTFGVLGV